MFIATIPNRKSPPAILLRESYREAGKVKTRTLANLSKLPPEAIEAVRCTLKGQKLLSPEEAFEIPPHGSLAHGHVEAVLLAMQRLGLSRLIHSRPSRQRDLVLALVAARVLKPQPKTATTRWWSTTTLPEMLGVTGADEDELYDAMDWLLERQGDIEKKLAARHLEENPLALYDLTSSYFEGVTCPLAARGHNRDKKKGKMITQKQINNLRDIEHVDWISALRPEAIKKLVTGDALQMSLFDEQNLCEIGHPDFPGERLVVCRNPELEKRRRTKRQSLLEATAKELTKVQNMVSRGRLFGRDVIQARIDKVLSSHVLGKYYHIVVRDDGFDYGVDQESLVEELTRQARGNRELFDKKSAQQTKQLQSINAKLERIRKMTEKGRLRGQDALGMRVGKVINKYKVSKLFDVHVEDKAFRFEVNQGKVDDEAALDGIYVVRTSIMKENMTAHDAVRSYKLLSNVERAFRCLKSVDLLVRPIRHHLER